MKIGIFGGSFNPLHNTHVYIAEYILKVMELDKIIIIPVGIPSHKNIKMASGKLRLNMCQEAFKNNSRIIVSDIEVNLNTTSFTIDTLKKLIDIYGKDNEFYEIVGEDSINTLKTWKSYKEILELSKIVVFKRFNSNKENNLQSENIIYLDTPVFETSSTSIRNKIKNNEDISNDVPESVLKIIKENKLYKD